MDLISCKIGECDKPVKVKSLGLCQAHYFRLRRTGSFGEIPIRKYGEKSICRIDDCGEYVHGQGLCDKHYQRFVKWGDPFVVKSFSRHGDENPSWKGGEIGYYHAHRRVTKTREVAKEYRCEQCGKQAKRWAYNHKDPNERLEGKLRYSSSPEFYIPLCIPCHKKHDLALIRERLGFDKYN